MMAVIISCLPSAAVATRESLRSVFASCTRLVASMNANGGYDAFTFAAASLTMPTGVRLAMVDDGVSSGDVNEKLLAKYLYAPDMPDPDLMIRTSGEYRISNFLLWEIAYAELLFIDVQWPEFRRAHLKTCLDEYTARERRFGLTSAQLVASDVES